MIITGAELDEVRARVFRVWRRLRGPLTHDERDECLARVLLVLVETRERIRSLPEFTFRVARTVIRWMRKQQQRDLETAATIAFASTRFDDLPAHIPVPTPTGWGGARARSGGSRPGAGRRRTNPQVAEHDRKKSSGRKSKGESLSRRARNSAR